jgi:hypothetical protein
MGVVLRGPDGIRWFWVPDREMLLARSRSSLSHHGQVPLAQLSGTLNDLGSPPFAWVEERMLLKRVLLKANVSEDCGRAIHREWNVSMS